MTPTLVNEEALARILQSADLNVGLLEGAELEGRHMTINGERVPMEFRPSRILSVGGPPVRR